MCPEPGQQLHEPFRGMGGRRDGPGFQSFFCSRRALCVTSHLRPYFLTCERGVKALTSSTVPRGRLSASQKLIRRNYVFAVTSPYTGCPALLGPKGAAPALHPERGYLKQGDFEGRYEKRNAPLDLQGSQLLRRSQRPSTRVATTTAV